MSEQKEKKNVAFVFPNQIVGRTDLSRVIRELEKIDDYMYQTNLRAPGTSNALPKLTRSLNDLAELNHLSLLDQNHRKQLMDVLRELQEVAPQIHISFAVEPSADFMQKIVAWVRQNIHPYLIVNVGLQPSVVVGCSLRTTNKIFDMSLRNRFADSGQLLIKVLEEATNGK